MTNKRYVYNIDIEMIGVMVHATTSTIKERPAFENGGGDNTKPLNQDSVVLAMPSRFFENSGDDKTKP